MALILSLDSTTSFCSAAIHEDGILIDSDTDNETRTAASKLAVIAKNLLDKHGISAKNLSSVAVCSGPGSYTGLRIAASTAKGICFAIEKPLIAADSLQVMTYAIVNTIDAELFCPMLDARRMEVYCSLFNSNLEMVMPIEAKILTDQSFSEDLKSSRIAFFGDGSVKFKALANHTNAIFVDSINPNAKDLGILAFEKFVKKDFEDLANFEPFYLKDFIMKR